MAKVYRIARDMDRQIHGFDLLIIDYSGMRFMHPSFMREGESIFEGSLAMCKAIVSRMKNCFVVDQGGNKLPS